jgi:iron-sulfur cluster assembly protein|tara:strand:+ start:829 stop:1161 length:333 start_codon:yes stop_codon:yes gene_type:complete
MSVSITEKAAAEVAKVKTEQDLDDSTFLRVGVVGGGCSGFSYSLKFESEFDESSDNRYTHHGVDVVVDKKSDLYLDGTVIDWYDDLDRRGFTFENPNAVKSCGCGSSFQA